MAVIPARAPKSPVPLLELLGVSCVYGLSRSERVGNSSEVDQSLYDLNAVDEHENPP